MDFTSRRREITKISCDSTKMRLAHALMRKRQPCSLIPTTSQACKKAPNLQKAYTLIFMSVVCLGQTPT